MKGPGRRGHPQVAALARHPPCCLSPATEHVFCHLNFAALTAAHGQRVLCFRLFSCGNPRKANECLPSPRLSCPHSRCLPPPPPHPPLHPHGASLGPRATPVLTDAGMAPPALAGGPGCSCPFLLSQSLPPFSFLVIFNPLALLSTFSWCCSQERSKLLANVRSRLLAGQSEF